MQVVKTSLFISPCILRDLPKQKIPREVFSGGEPAIFLHSHVAMERCFDGTDQENSKTRGERGQIRKVQKNKKERMEERKRTDFYRMWRCPYSCVLHRSGTRPQATTIVQPFLRRTHLYKNLPYKKQQQLR